MDKLGEQVQVSFPTQEQVAAIDFSSKFLSSNATSWNDAIERPERHCEKVEMHSGHVQLVLYSIA